MTDRQLPTLTRRRLLASAGAIGAGLATTGTGALALLSDEEQTTSSVTAGTLDLELDWVKYYHGRELHTGIQEPTSDPGPIFELEDVKPGDCGGGCISVHVRGNPAYVFADLGVTANEEHGLEEPEQGLADEDGPSEGELPENVRVVARPFGYLPSADPGSALETYHEQFVRESCPDGDEFDEEDCYFLGSLPEMVSVTDGGYLLDGGLSPLNSGDQTQPFIGNSTYLVDFTWWIPDDVGSEIQGDSLTFDLSLIAVQARHLEDPENYEYGQ